MVRTGTCHTRLVLTRAVLGYVVILVLSCQSGVASAGVEWDGLTVAILGIVVAGVIVGVQAIPNTARLVWDRLVLNGATWDFHVAVGALVILRIPLREILPT